MRNKLIILVIVIIILVMNVGCKEKGITMSVCKIIHQTTTMVIMKDYMGEDYTVQFGQNEMNEFKRLSKNISNLSIYESNPQTIGEFKKGYRAIFMTGKKDKYFTLLYSLDEKRLIVRRRDVFPEKMDESFEITVYEFNAPEALFGIIKKKEEELPDGGDYYKSWHFID